MSRSYEWRRGHDSVIRFLGTAGGCKACAAEALGDVFGTPSSDYALGMRDACRAAIEKGHTCRERGGIGESR